MSAAAALANIGRGGQTWLTALRLSPAAAFLTVLLHFPITRWSQVEECVDGGSLKNWVAKSMRGKRLYNLRDSVRWLMQMAQALQYLHECLPMVIHRDLKLDNILLQGGWSSTNASLLLAA